MKYVVKEIDYTLQGFLRCAGCNLWTGREEDRASAVCRFCDTDFVGTDGPGGGTFGSASTLTSATSCCNRWTAPTSGATPSRPLPPA